MEGSIISGDNAMLQVASMSCRIFRGKMVGSELAKRQKTATGGILYYLEGRRVEWQLERTRGETVDWVWAGRRREVTEWFVVATQ